LVVCRRLRQQRLRQQRLCQQRLRQQRLRQRTSSSTTSSSTNVFVNNVFVNNVFVTTTPCVKQSKAGRALRPPWVSALPQDVPTTNDSPLHPVCIAPLTIAQMLIPHRDCIICLGIILIIEEELTVQFEEQPERVVSSKLLADLDCFPKMS